MQPHGRVIATELRVHSLCFVAVIGHNLCFLKSFFAVFSDDVAHFFDMFPRMQNRPLRGLLAVVSMLQRLERPRGPCLLLPRLFLLRRYILPLGHHGRDAFVRVFLFLALGLDRFRLRLELHPRGKAAFAQAVRDLDLDLYTKSAKVPRYGLIASTTSVRASVRESRTTSSTSSPALNPSEFPI